MDVTDFEPSPDANLKSEEIGSDVKHECKARMSYINPV